MSETYYVSGDYGMAVLLVWFAVIFAIIALIAFAISEVAYYKTFEKMEFEGWKGLIPIYRDFVLTDEVATHEMAIALVVLEVVPLVVIPLIPTLAVLSFSTTVASFVLECIVYNKLSRGFGKGTAFTVGLLFLNFVFMAILGFGAANYDHDRIEA